VRRSVDRALLVVAGAAVLVAALDWHGAGLIAATIAGVSIAAAILAAPG